MNLYSKFAKNLLQDESGQDLIEYALVAALVGVAAVGSMHLLNTAITNSFNSITASLNTSV